MGRVSKGLGMSAVDELYNGYGECLELCDAGTTDSFCVFDASGQCAGVSMSQLLNVSNANYLDAFPRLDRASSVVVTADIDGLLTA